MSRDTKNGSSGWGRALRYASLGALGILATATDPLIESLERGSTLRGAARVAQAAWLFLGWVVALATLSKANSARLFQSGDAGKLLAAAAVNAVSWYLYASWVYSPFVPFLITPVVVIWFVVLLLRGWLTSPR